MKLSILSLVVITLCLAIGACKRITIPDSQPLITQQATPCFGSCPVYAINIYENGVVTLRAERFLKMEGEYRAKLKQAELERLVDLFEKEIFQFRDQYTGQVSDLPTIYISFNYKGRQKKIEDYYGAPETLKKIEAEIFSLVNQLKWEKSD